MSMYPYIDDLMIIQNKINCGMNENNLGDLYGIIEEVFKNEKIEELFFQMEMYINEDSLEHKIDKMLNILTIVRDYAQNHRIQYVTKYSDLDMVGFYGKIYFLLLRKTKNYDNYIRILNNLKDIYNGSIKTFSRFHYSYILNMVLLIKEKYISIKKSDFIRDNYMYKINVVDNKKIIETISFNLLDAIYKIMKEVTYFNRVSAILNSYGVNIKKSELKKFSTDFFEINTEVSLKDISECNVEISESSISVKIPEELNLDNSAYCALIYDNLLILTTLCGNGYIKKLKESELKDIREYVGVKVFFNEKQYYFEIVN